MAYDPNLPANNSPIVSAELRAQFAGLKALIDGLDAALLTQQTNIAGLQSQVAALQTQIQSGGAKSIQGFTGLADEISDPPQKIEVEDIQAKLNDLIAALQY